MVNLLKVHLNAFLSSISRDFYCQLPLQMLNPGISCFENTVDPEQLASNEASCSGSTLFPTLAEITSCKTSMLQFNWRSVVKVQTIFSRTRVKVKY